MNNQKLLLIVNSITSLTNWKFDHYGGVNHTDHSLKLSAIIGGLSLLIRPIYLNFKISKIHNLSLISFKFSLTCINNESFYLHFVFQK